MKRRLIILLKSKTLWGAVFAAGSWLASQPKIGVAEIVQAVGTVLSAAGVRDAITQMMAPPTITLVPPRPPEAP